MTIPQGLKVESTLCRATRYCLQCWELQESQIGKSPMEMPVQIAQHILQQDHHLKALRLPGYHT